MHPGHKASQKQIISIIRRSLSTIDARLINHGRRVAYIADAIAGMSGGMGIDSDILLILSLLHDIGAYKTEEINNMVSFETDDVMAHAAYGYAFLHNTTPLVASSEAILYHHLAYNKLKHVESPYTNIAALLFLADRIDILLLTHAVCDWTAVTSLAGNVFSPELVEMFLAAEQKLHLSDRIRSGAYRQAMDERIDAIRLPEEEIHSFLRMLIYSIDFRSPYTVTHTANTTCLSVALARTLGFAGEALEAVRVGAFLHDIGKISIPDSILEHPGKLDATQMRRMRTHVAASEGILAGLISDDICQIAIRHHEKLNGTGYPRGLIAPELSLAQRIVAVADTLSALIGRRSYKEPFPKEKTLAIIADMKNRGELCGTVCGLVTAHYDYLLQEVAISNDPVLALYEKIRGDFSHADQLLRALMDM